MSQNDVMSCNITASFLGSGRILANAANAAAIVAGVGCAMAGPVYSRLALAGSILLWFFESYFAVRVAIDSSLFRVLASDPAEVAHHLDSVLGTANRSIADRTRGALGLWRKQIAALTIQLAMLIAGILLRIANL